MVIVPRRATIEARIEGVLLSHVVLVSWSGGFNQPYNEGKIVVTQLPSGFDMDQGAQIIAGNGYNHTTRLLGITRSPIYNLDGTITIQVCGNLIRAYEFENGEDPTLSGGLFLEDLIGSDSGTDSDVIQAVLDRAGVIFSPGNIGGTGVTFGAQQVSDLSDAFLWASGDTPNLVPQDQGAGETALEYISRWDKVSAVHPGPFAPAGSFFANSPGAVTSPVGFFRTFETLGGVVYRTLIGGRPRGTPTIPIPFTEGVDIRVGQITRGHPVANRFVAVGFDDGVGNGPERFVMQSSNPYQGTGHFTAPPISSPMIEKTAENDPGPGMSCEKVTYAMEPDLNRIIVSGTITTGRDDFITHGATILVQGPGGAPSRLGTGENVWVQAVRGSASIQGFVQEIEVLGGGVPDDYTPAPPV